MTSFKRGVALSVAASAISPVIGIVTAPVLTHALGTSGRGASSAILAPNLFIISVATLGLPGAITYYVAKKPHLIKRILGVSVVLGMPVAIVAVIAALSLTPVLSDGDHSLYKLMGFASLVAIPTLVLEFVRGAAIGMQRWVLTSAESVIGPVVKLITYVALAEMHRLTVTSAVFILALTPLMSGLVYSRLIIDHVFAASPASPGGEPLRGTVRSLFSFGWRSWIGSVSVMLLARLPSLMVAPLSSFTQLGLLVVADTVAAIPWIVSTTIHDVLLGSSSARRNDSRLASTTALLFTLTVIGSAVLGAATPWLMEPLFGPGFGAAALPTCTSLASSTLAVPGLLAAAGMAAENHPEVRSFAVAGSLVLYVIGMVLFVPHFGAAGASIVGLVTNIVITATCLRSAHRILGIRPRDFLIPELSAVKDLWVSFSGLSKRFVRSK